MRGHGRTRRASCGIAVKSALAALGLLAAATPAAAQTVEVGILYGSFWTTGLESTLSAQPAIDVSTFTSCDAATLSQFDVIWLYGNGSCYDEAAFDAFAQGGGGIVGTPWAMGNEGHDQAMFPYSESGDSDVYHGSLDSVVIDAADPILDGVAFVNGDAVGYENCSSPSVRAGASVPAEWADGDPLVAHWEYGAGRAVYLNLHYITSDCDLAINHGWGQQLAVNAVLWAAAAGCGDNDGDGHVSTYCGGDDCDDTDAAIHPGAAEVTCDGVDNDCDAASEDAPDGDGDGHDLCSDCDDDNAAVYPGAAESCNGVDDDCDGDVDEGFEGQGDTYYRDNDGDGYGDPAHSLLSCLVPAGYVLDGTDCNDYQASINPGAAEVCNQVDDDCDGDVDEGTPAQDWYPDVDGDGYGDRYATPVNACTAPAGHVTDDSDCDDDDAAVFPGAIEVCNGVDDDCDASVDGPGAVDALPWYADADGDTFGDAAASEMDCAAPPGHVADATDCDDADPLVFPGATETCNGVDDDCDGTIDEPDAAGAPTWYADADGDGFGDPAAPAVGCTPPADHVGNLGDCDDGDAAIHPGAAEVPCDGLDNDCQPLSPDEPDGDGDGHTLCEDCDDGDAHVFPGADEVCDGVDTDCDGALPDDEADADDDGWMACDDGDGADCDDDDPTTWPGAPEQCDQLDNDCDGLVDEDVDEDVDGDGFNACQGDCDNGDPAVYPGADEVCDGVDNDCDGALPDDEADADADGWMACVGAPNGGDCDDDDPAAAPDLAEVCDDGVDNDCDGLTDDADGDDCAADGDDDSALNDPGDCQCRTAAGPAFAPLALALPLLGLALRRRRS